MRTLSRLLAATAVLAIPLATAATAQAGTAKAADRQLNTTGAQPMATWFSGTLDPNDTQNWVWNNASANAVFKVGLSPVGASTSADCRFETIRSWDVQQPSGEREFHWTIKNVGTIACGTNVLLSSLSAVNSFASGGINAGGSKSWTWNNANPLDASFLAGLRPSGATSTAACQLEVTSDSYVDQPSGEREFHLTVQNTGTIACQGTVLIASKVRGNSFNIGPIGSGNTGSYVWNNAPTNLVFLPGLTPNGATATTACRLEITRMWYEQTINSTGSAERELHFTVHNPSSISCSAVVDIAFFAA
jgi:hypothetical protein